MLFQLKLRAHARYMDISDQLQMSSTKLDPVIYDIQLAGQFQAKKR